MKTELIVLDEPQPAFTYPCLLRYRRTGMVVFFDDRSSGLVKECARLDGRDTILGMKLHNSAARNRRLRRDLSLMKTRVDDVEMEKVSLQEELEVAVDARNRQQVQLNSLEEKEQMLKDLLETLKADYNHMQHQNRNLLIRLDSRSRTKELFEARQEIDELRSEQNGSNQRFRDKDNELQAAKVRIEELEKMARNLRSSPMCRCALEPIPGVLWEASTSPKKEGALAEQAKEIAILKEQLTSLKKTVEELQAKSWGDNLEKGHAD